MRLSKFRVKDSDGMDYLQYEKMNIGITFNASATRELANSLVKSKYSLTFTWICQVVPLYGLKETSTVCL